MKRKHIFQILIVTLLAGYLTVFYGMRNTIDTSFEQHAVQAATQQISQLYSSSKRTFLAKHLSRSMVTAAQAKVNQLVHNVENRDQKKIVAKDKRDADAASNMLTIQEATNAQSSNLAQIESEGTRASAAYKAIVAIKPAFAADYQQAVTQLYKKSLAIAQIKKLYNDQNLQHPKADLSSSNIDLAINAIENVENQDFAKNVLPLVQVAKKSQANNDTTVAMESTDTSSTKQTATTGRQNQQDTGEPASGVSGNHATTAGQASDQTSQPSQKAPSQPTTSPSGTSSSTDNNAGASASSSISASANKAEPMTAVLSGGLYKTYDDAVASIKIQGKAVDDMTIRSVTMSDGSFQWTWGPNGDSGSSSSKPSSSAPSSSNPTGQDANKNSQPQH